MLFLYSDRMICLENKDLLSIYLHLQDVNHCPDEIVVKSGIADFDFLNLDIVIIMILT